jgi:hypothetical protein
MLSWVALHTCRCNRDRARSIRNVSRVAEGQFRHAGSFCFPMLLQTDLRYYYTTDGIKTTCVTHAVSLLFTRPALIRYRLA